MGDRKVGSVDHTSTKGWGSINGIIILESLGIHRVGRRTTKFGPISDLEVLGDRLARTSMRFRRELLAVVEGACAPPSAFLVYTCKCNKNDSAFTCSSMIK